MEEPTSSFAPAARSSNKQQKSSSRRLVAVVLFAALLCVLNFDAIMKRRQLERKLFATLSDAEMTASSRSNKTTTASYTEWIADAAEASWEAATNAFDLEDIEHAEATIKNITTGSIDWINRAAEISWTAATTAVADILDDEAEHRAAALATSNSEHKMNTFRNITRIRRRETELNQTAIDLATKQQALEDQTTEFHQMSGKRKQKEQERLQQLEEKEKKLTEQENELKRKMLLQKASLTAQGQILEALVQKDEAIQKQEEVLKNKEQQLRGIIGSITAASGTSASMFSDTII